MIYILFISLAVLFVISYLFSGRDFFAPATVQILTFAGAAFMCIYFMRSMDAPHRFHRETVEIVLAAMALSAIVGIVVHHLFSKVEIEGHSPRSVAISPISRFVSLFILFVLLLTIAWLLVEIRRIGGTSGGFTASMSRFRKLHSYSTKEKGRLPWLLNQLVSMTHVLFLLYGFNLIRFYRELALSQKLMNAVILGVCCLAMLLTGARTPVINYTIGLCVMFHLLRIQRQGGYEKYRFKFFVRALILFIVVLAAFFLTKRFVGRIGRNSTMNPVDYISYYTGAGYITLDQYLQYPPSPSNIWGKETFYSLIRFLISYGFYDAPPYIIHLEFRPVGAGFTSNVYTFLRSYHHDFGMVGMCVLHLISILFLSSFFEYVKRKRGNLGILVFSMMYYSVVMSFFAERFYSNIVSLNFVKMLVMLLALYELLIRKRVRLVFPWTASELPNAPGGERLGVGASPPG